MVKDYPYLYTEDLLVLDSCREYTDPSHLVVSREISTHWIGASGRQSSLIILTSISLATFFGDQGEIQNWLYAFPATDSRVVYPNSMTTLQLVCFDGEIEFLGSLLAPRSLPKMSEFFSRGQNLKWPPGITEMSINNAL